MLDEDRMLLICVQDCLKTVPANITVNLSFSRLQYFIEGISLFMCPENLQKKFLALIFCRNEWNDLIYNIWFHIFLCIFKTGLFFRRLSWLRLFLLYKSLVFFLFNVFLLLLDNWVLLTLKMYRWKSRDFVKRETWSIERGQIEVHGTIVEEIRAVH